MIESAAQTRRLAAILAADVAGYSRLMALDEAGTVTRLEVRRRIFRETVERHRGRVVDTAGDSALAVFETATDSVAAALEVQKTIDTLDTDAPALQRMRFRIGINLGEVIGKDDGTIYGDGVNIAARLQELSEPGSLCISGAVHDQVAGKMPVQFSFLGEQLMKNIPQAVRTYRLGLAGTKRPQRRIAAGIAVTLLVLGAVAYWQYGRIAAPALKNTTSPELAMPTGPVIAVLPFTNMSGDRKEEYFADGLTEDIITELSRFRELHVLARNTTFQFKGKAVDVAEIGRKLGAKYVMEGSVRRAGKQIRVTAQLIDTSSGTHLWAERYDRADKEIFAIQDEITGRVVGAIAGGATSVLLMAERATGRRKAPEQMRAYDLVLQAVDKPSYSVREYPVRKALLEQAIRVDPGYARARHEYAWTLLNGWIFRFEKTLTPPEEIFRSAIKAVELDPSDAYAHRTAAYGYFFGRQLDLFEKEARAAFDLAPYNAEILSQLGMAITFSGQWARGTELLRKAYSLNPASTGGWYHSGMFYDLYRKGKYRESIEVVRQHPTQSLCETQMKYVAAYGQLGDLVRAKEHFDQCAVTTPGFSADFMARILRIWNFPEPYIITMIDGYVKAGHPCQYPGCRAP